MSSEGLYRKRGSRKVLSAVGETRMEPVILDFGGEKGKKGKGEERRKSWRE